jgi:hypothetical protein
LEAKQERCKPRGKIGVVANKIISVTLGFLQNVLDLVQKIDRANKIVMQEKSIFIAFAPQKSDRIQKV